MKIIEHRRHAKRTKPSPHLNSAGVAAARMLGEGYRPLPYFDLVITSPKWRAVETAVAMGFAVDQTARVLEEVPDVLNERVAWNSGFSSLSDALPERGEGARFLQKLQMFLMSAVEKIPEGGKILIISHGGVVEWSALACLPDEASALGDAIGLCEGVRLTWDQGRWTSVKALRL